MAKYSELSQFEKDIERLKTQERKNIAKVLRILSKPIMNFMKMSAPVDSGALRKSIATKIIQNRYNPYSLGFLVGVRSDYSKKLPKSIKKKKGKSGRGRTTVPTFWYNPSIEFGSRRVKGKIIKVKQTAFTRKTYNTYRTKIKGSLQRQLGILREQFKRSI